MTATTSADEVNLSNLVALRHFAADKKGSCGEFGHEDSNEAGRLALLSRKGSAERNNGQLHRIRTT